MADENINPMINQEPPKIKLDTGDGDPKPAQPRPATITIKPPSKSETSRISLVSAIPPKGNPPVAAHPVGESPKKSTSRIQVPTDQIPISPEQLEAAKKTTVRVQIDDIKKGDTQQLQAAKLADAHDGLKRKTTQINLSEVLPGEEEDIFKRRTTLLDSSKFPTPATQSTPRTIRIKQEGGPGATSAIRQPTEQIIKPAEPTTIESSKKSETARIDLPDVSAEDMPPTRRKTIRIKRPEGTGSISRPLVITPSPAAMEAEESVAEEKDEPGVLFFAMAAVAVLIAVATIAVQSLALRSFGQY